MAWNRKTFLQSLAVCGTLLSNPTTAFSIGQGSSGSNPVIATANKAEQLACTSPTIAYRSLSLAMGDQFGGANVPVACWYPLTNGDSSTATTISKQTDLTYPHRISVRRIGQMLAGWEFIPDLVSRNFPLIPGGSVINGQSLPLPAKAPVVFLAHGYLGSRFDLSHLAEALAAEGFVCLSPEYPESLAASYDPWEGLDRQVITQQLFQAVQHDWQVEATSYGIVGHSLGCGTAIRTGDETWTRVCISGFPGSSASIPGKVLFLSSMNDGVVSLRTRGGMAAIPSDYVQLVEPRRRDDNNDLTVDLSPLPQRAALIFDRPDAPNHISFLAEGVNDAMVDFLSPLLPVAQALSIPVLDFDRYQQSRDSIATAEIVTPLVTRYMKQHMKMT